MNPLLQTVLYLLVLVCAFVASTYRMKRRARSERVFSGFLGLTLLCEIAAVYFDLRFHNNMPVYHVYAPIMLVVVTLYFFLQLEVLRRYGLAYIILIVGVAGAILNSIYLQPLRQWNSNAILLSGLLIVGMCLLYFRKLFLETGNRPLFLNLNFWLAFVLMFFWSSTFFIWAVLQVFLIKGMFSTLNALYLVIWLVNMLSYMAIAAAFIYFKPLK